MEEEYKEIDLKQLFFVLLDKVWLILVTTIIFVLAAILITKYVQVPVYVSTTSVYVMNRQNNESVATSSDLTAATQLTKDYEAMVTSRNVLEQVIEKLSLSLGVGDLKGMISVANPSNTRILEISISSTDPYLAKNIADAIAEISAGEIVNFMGIEKVNIIDKGNVPEGPSKPVLKKNVAIAAFIGFMLSCCVILFVFLLDDRIRSAEDVEKHLELSVLGIIPIEESALSPKKKKKRNKKPKLKS